MPYCMHRSIANYTANCTACSPSHWKVVVPVVCDCDCECGADEVNTPARF